VDLPQLQLQLVKTNAVASADQTAFDDDADLDEAAANEGAVDPVLDEAKRVMADYVALVNKDPVISKVP